ncbi:AraC family transcriptional regulator [Sphingomonas sp. LaA6.9]|uniref:AraC family transcriptional regulator n=1 Tax=Sphingomonas sp. LaA6.9 TaxID=2919914 RepID=UPI001F4F57B7|nr:AraC family transcriptional regulator [Sphingomonas sp. LaA6.9]MCJ8157070.1 AraC family transcriptional regulator [Sphingomonas sp. LaA6.9]
MAQERLVWIFSGRFGRATVNLNDRPLVEHSHRQINILFKMGGADAIFQADGKDIVLDDQNVLLFNSWLPHAKLANDDKPTLILSLFIEPAWLSEMLPETTMIVESLFPGPSAELNEEVRMLANRLASAIPTHVRDIDDQCGDLLLSLMDALVTNYADSSLDRALLPRRRMVDFRIRKALAYIHENALKNPRMEEVAREVGLSRSRFFEQFRRCVGTSPQHYADYVRLTMATRRLSTSDLPLIELADELGFAGHSNFTRFFTQHIGVSPSEFRRQTTSGDAAAS